MFLKYPTNVKVKAESFVTQNFSKPSKFSLVPENFINTKGLFIYFFLDFMTYSANSLGKENIRIFHENIPELLSMSYPANIGQKSTISTLKQI